MASIQARHSRACALGRPWTPFTLPDGCTCATGPVYHVVTHVAGKLVRERIGRNRRQAERALNKVAHEVDEGAYTPPTTKTAAVWLDEWHTGLRGPKASTRESYRSSIALAKAAFGHRRLRDIGAGDLERMLTLADERGLSRSTAAKHLRVIHAAFAEAERRGLIGRNPARLLGKAQRPRAQRREAGYFDDEDLARIAPELDGVFRVAFAVCLGSGLRQGEALALTWGDVSMTEKTITVRRTWTRHGGPTTAPKSNQRRDVHVADDLLETLAAWWAECGKPGNDVLVLPGPDGYLSPWALLRQLQGAMKRAGVPVEHPRTGARRNWHSLRHSHARVALQAGASLDWLRVQLGHSGPAVTAIYAHWAETASRREAERLTGAFAF